MNTNPDPVTELLSEYVDAYQRGEEPDLERFLAEHPQHAEELRPLLETFLRLEAPREPVPVDTEAAWQRFCDTFLDAEIARLEEVQNKPLDVVLQQLEKARQLSRREMPHALARELACPPEEVAVVKHYYHKLETGQLDVTRVNHQVFEALSRLLQVPAALLEQAARAMRPPARVAYTLPDPQDAATAPSRRTPGRPPSRARKLFLGE
ncbi:MAG: hypothetical protein ACYCW6_09515 [Candidatus Xenobia bacterium]